MKRITGKKFQVGASPLWAMRLGGFSCGWARVSALLLFRAFKLAFLLLPLHFGLFVLINENFPVTLFHFPLSLSPARTCKDLLPSWRITFMEAPKRRTRS